MVRVRHTHQRSLEAMQTSLEAELRCRGEAVRLRKKMEVDLNEMELQLSQANRQAAESMRLTRHLQAQVRPPYSPVETCKPQILTCRHRYAPHTHL